MKLGIKSKLVITLLLANTLVAIAMYWISSKSFDDSFSDFIKQVELQKLDPFIQELSLLYQREQSWDQVENQRGLWGQVIEYHVLKRDQSFQRGLLRPLERNDHRPPRRPDNIQRQSRDGFRLPPPPNGYKRPRPNHFKSPDTIKVHDMAVKRIDDSYLNINPQIILKNQSHRLIKGMINPDIQYEWLPIKVNGELVGELGVIYRHNVTSDLEQYFVDRQKTILATMIFIMLSAGFLVAFLLANRLLKVTDLLKQGLSKLVAGDFNHSLPEQQKDELGQLSSDINFLSKTLKENQLSRQQWIADISHELRTPIAILKGELEALIDGIRQTDKNTLLSLHQETDRLARLINDLHELSLSDLGALSYEKETINFVEFVSEYVEDQTTRSDLNELNIEIKTTLTACSVNIDVKRIEQCLNNLMQNTIRYTDFPGQLCISIEKKNREVILCWEDSSPGVSQTDLNHLFERLYRVEQSRNRAKGGAGLGMSICKNIIAAHAADISLFQSDLGGLGIKIKFPMVN